MRVKLQRRRCAGCAGWFKVEKQGSKRLCSRCGLVAGSLASQDAHVRVESQRERLKRLQAEQGAHEGRQDDPGMDERAPGYPDLLAYASEDAELLSRRQRVRILPRHKRRLS